MSTLYEELKKLHSEELWDSLCYATELFLAIDEKQFDAMQPMLKFQAAVFYADALFHLERYREAERAYMRALSVRRNVQRVPETRRCSSVFLSEPEVKFRLHLCLIRQEKLEEGVGVLESIPLESRSAKTEAALGKLYVLLGKESLASKRYFELSKASVFSLDSLVHLLESGTSKESIEMLLENSAEPGRSLMKSLDWMSTWLAAHEAMSNREYEQAAGSFVELSERSGLGSSGVVMGNLGRAYYFAGEKQKAISALQRAHSLDPLRLQGMDLLASLLSEENRTKELEALATALMTDSPKANEPWIAFGYLCLSQKKYSKALYFAHKVASSADRSQVEGIVLKGRVLLLSGKLEEASQHFREALNLESHRIEIYDGLTKALIKQDRYAEALGFAELSRKNFGEDFPRALALHAIILAQNPSSNETEREGGLKKAVKLLEKALDNAPHLLSAVYVLVELYGKQRQHEKAVALLRKQADLHLNSRLHRMLGEFLSKTNQPTEAVNSYHYALCLDPEDQASAEGLEMANGMLSNTAFATPDAPAANGFSLLVNAPPRRGALHLDLDSAMDDSF